MYHYLYKITNDFDECYYYGIHSTENLEDSYMGSGTRLWNAYRKHGLWHFTKEILEYFETRELALKREAEIVNEDLIKDPLCYNIVLGGGNSAPTGTVVVQIIGTEEFILIPKDEYHANKHLYITASTGKISCILKETGEKVIVTQQEFYNNRNKYQIFSEGLVSVKDKDNNYFHVSKDDPRYLSGELVFNWTGAKHSKETLEKMKTTHALNKHQQGSKNSHFNHCWITKDGQSLSIHKDELENYIRLGWKLGRVITNTEKMKAANQNKIWIHKDNETKLIYKSNAKYYKDLGWEYGRNTPKRIRKRDNLEFWNNL